MFHSSLLEHNRQHVLSRIQKAQKQVQRHDEIQLIAVSKTFPSSDIDILYQYGQRDFGENYIQEWQKKITELQHCPQLIWHIIGHIQSNKSRLVAEQAHWVHTIDRIKLAQRLNQQRPHHLPPLNVLIEINISGQPNKHGIAPAELANLALAIQSLPRLTLRGLMCVASTHANETQLANEFHTMQQLLQQLQHTCATADTLSMGMSQDLEIAIANGANMVRIGHAIFGQRHYPNHN